jgi:hypothetical protein
LHLLTEKRTQPHVLKPFARVEGARLTDPPTEEEAERDVQRS